MEKISSIIANAKTAAAISEGKIIAATAQVNYLHEKISQSNEELAQAEEKSRETCEKLGEVSQKLKSLDFGIKQARDAMSLLEEENRLISIENTGLNEEIGVLKNKQAIFLANIDSAIDALQKGISADKFWPMGDAKDFFEQIIKILGKDLNEDQNQSPGSA